MPKFGLKIVKNILRVFLFQYPQAVFICPRTALIGKRGPKLSDPQAMFRYLDTDMLIAPAPTLLSKSRLIHGNLSSLIAIFIVKYIYISN